MATGDELSQTLQADAATYTLTVQGRTAGGQTPEVLASVVVGKKIDAVAAARRSGVSSADSTANLDAAGYIGANNIDVSNSMHVALSARFSAASQSCVCFLAFYDESDGLIGISEDIAFQGDATYRESSSGNYMSPMKIVDTMCAAQVYVVLRTAPASGDVDLYLEAI